MTTRLPCDPVSCLFFFFQAEDGIRDPLVTGVQTCALPIWPTRPTRCHSAFRCSSWCAPERGRISGVTPAESNREPRSEERRVGKGVDLGGRSTTKKKNEQSRARPRQQQRNV